MKKSLRELEEFYGGVHTGLSKSGKQHQGGDRCIVNNYDIIYEKYLPKDPKIIVEVGSFEGIGLRVLSDYFPNSRIIGLDISPETVKDGGRAEIYYFNQLAPSGLNEILKGEKIDVVIDDGLHRAFSMVYTYKYFQPHLNTDAIYFIEDITSKELMPNYINDCEQFNPKKNFGRIAVVTKHDKPLKQAGLDLIKKYRGQLK
jgi:hypothetical protein